MIKNAAAVLVVSGIVFAWPAQSVEAKVVRLVVERSSPYAGGKDFGETGAFERHCQLGAGSALDCRFQDDKEWRALGGLHPIYHARSSRAEGGLLDRLLTGCQRPAIG
jgi:hypothetical protein